ncbi:hypothetical protein GG851_18920 [Bordetella petrii]|nr:hypothetical protein [Bordetella petrii]
MTTLIDEGYDPGESPLIQLPNLEQSSSRGYLKINHGAPLSPEKSFQ